MKDLKAIKGKAYIHDLISQGEHVQQDFKFLISDARKIAKSISAFANNQGGRLLIGVKDNGTIAGIRNEEDIYVIEQAAQMYCNPPQEIEFTAFQTGDTGIVIRASISQASERPVLAQEHDGSWRAYYRVADENIQAHGLMVRAWRHLASGRRTLFHLDGADGILLSALADRSHLTIREALMITGASRRISESAIIRLAALGIIEFDYRDGEFVLVRNEET